MKPKGNAYVPLGEGSGKTLVIMVKAEKFDYIHLIYHFTIPLKFNYLIIRSRSLGNVKTTKFYNIGQCLGNNNTRVPINNCFRVAPIMLVFLISGTT